MAIKFRVRLKAAHDAKGQSVYEVAEALGISKNTVQRYAKDEEVLQDQLKIAVAQLAKYYGVPYESVVDVVEVDDVEGQTETPFAAA